MKKISNPYVGQKNYFCFGCSPDNSYGLQLEFFEDEEFVVANWKPKEHLQGFTNILHGGIQATLMDEIASWYILAKLKTAGVTSKIEVNYKRPVFMNKGPIKLKAILRQMKKNIAEIDVKIFSSEGKILTTGIISYFTFSKEEAKKRLNYFNEN